MNCNNAMDIRRMLLTHHETVELLRLTDFELWTFSYVKAVRGEVSAGEIAANRPTSHESANAILRKLWLKGYLTRRNEGDPTGGNLYYYKVSNDLL